MCGSVVAGFVAIVALGALAGAGCADTTSGSASLKTVSPASFGALGDGKANDTAALQRAFDSFAPGDTLKLSRGIADGIHITGDSHDGTVKGVTVERSGDDGVAVGSYPNDGTPARRVTVDRATVRDNTWGRGVSVVGGEDITYRHVKVEVSSSAAVYIASEGGSNNTFPPVRVKVEDAVLEDSNTAASVDHGAFLVYSGNPGSPPTDVTATRVTISGTRTSASSQVGVRADQGCVVAGVALTRFTVKGGSNVFSANTPDGTFTRSGWRVK